MNSKGENLFVSILVFVVVLGAVSVRFEEDAGYTDTQYSSANKEIAAFALKDVDAGSVFLGRPDCVSVVLNDSVYQIPVELFVQKDSSRHLTHSAVIANAQLVSQMLTLSGVSLNP